MQFLKHPPWKWRLEPSSIASQFQVEKQKKKESKKQDDNWR